MKNLSKKANFDRFISHAQKLNINQSELCALHLL